MEDSLLVTVLLIIVSVLLIIDIAIAVVIFKIVQKVRGILDRTDHIVENVETASNFAKGASVTAALGKIVQLTAEQFTKNTKKKK